MNDKIKITGIDRRVPVSQGSCFDILNLRYKDGTWQKINPKTLFYQYDIDIKNFFVHNITYNGLPLEIYIIYAQTSVKYFCTTQYSPTISGTLLLSQTQNLNFESLGNVLIVNSETDSIYFLFNNGSYTELPEIKQCIDCEFQVEKITDDSYLCKKYGGGTPEEIAAAFKSEYYPWIKTAHELNYQTGLFWITVAYRLKNGLYTRAKMPYPLYCQEVNNENFIEFIKAKIQFKYYDDGINSLKSNYADLIDGVSIFISESQSILDYTKVVQSPDPDYYTWEHNELKISNYYDNVNNFYEIKFIPLSELNINGISWEYLDFNQEQITSNNRLNLDAFDIIKVRSNNCIKYNNRLWRYNIVNTIKSDFISKIYAGIIEGELNYNITASYHTNSGWLYLNSIVKEGYLSNSAGFSYPPTTVGLPCLNIKECKFINNSVNPNQEFVITLRNHKYLPISFFENNGKLYWNGFTNDPFYYYMFTTYNENVLYTILNTLIPNEIRVSELAMPYFYPAVNSYTAGNGDIKALAINTSAVDQGQWGQFQVYAFTTEGTWALNVEGFDTVVNRISFVNSDKTINNNVLMIKGGIVHCTEDGIMILEGTKSIRIDTPVNQTINNPLDYNDDESKLLQTLLNQEFSVNKIIYDFTDFFDMQNLILAFDEYNNEVLFINNNKLFGEYIYRYMYCFSLDSKFWYRIYERFDKIIMDNPYQTAYGIRGRNIYYLYRETDMDNDVYFQTNPITFDCFIKLLRVILRGNIESNKIGFIIFSSLDGIKYYPIFGMQNINELNINDIIIKRNLFSAKYYVFVLAGNIIKTNIRDIDVMAEVKMGNKLH